MGSRGWGLRGSRDVSMVSETTATARSLAAEPGNRNHTKE